LGFLSQSVTPVDADRARATHHQRSLWLATARPSFHWVSVIIFIQVTHTIQASSCCFFFKFTRGDNREQIIWGGGGKTGSQCGKNGSEVIYTLNQETATLRERHGEISLLRTNTTRPSKCDRTANTVRGGWELGGE